MNLYYLYYLESGVVALFTSRTDAAQKLADILSEYKSRDQTIVLGILRGGAVLAHTLSRCLGLPWDVLGIKKIGAPFDPELAVGAVAPDGSIYVDRWIKEHYGVSDDYIEGTKARKLVELRDQLNYIRGSSSYGNLNSRIVIVTDDGVATGATMKAAISFVKNKNAQKIVVAVPVISPETFEELRGLADEVKALLIPEDFMAVGQFYLNFQQVTDDEVAKLYRSIKGENIS